MQREATIVATDGGKTVFRTELLDFVPVADAAPGGVFEATALGEGSGGIVVFPPGFRAVFHNTLAPTWMLMMAGEIEMEVSDGARRTFGAGDVIRFEDLDGPGHSSTTVGAQPAIAATVGFAP